MSRTKMPWTVSEVLSNRSEYREDQTGNLYPVREEIDICIEGDGLILFSIDSRPPEAKPNADFICLAVNNHEALVRVLGDVIRPQIKGWRVDDMKDRIEEARALLAKIESESRATNQPQANSPQERDE